MSEPLKKFLQISLWVAMIAFAIRCIVSWKSLNAAQTNEAWASLSYSLLGYAGEAAVVTALVMAVFEKWVWKWKPLNAITGGMPVLASCYSGSIISAYDHVKRDAQLLIKQSYLNISIVLKTKESSSSSVAATFLNLNEDPELIYQYRNEPRADLTSESPMHYGTAILKVRNPDFISGNYYTSRKTVGTMEFSKENT